MTDSGRCSCGNPGKDEHTCPYAEDVNDDHETLCNCCAECENRCCEDI